MALLRHAVKAAPKDAGVHADLGLTLARQSDWPAAQAALSRSLELAPRHSAARLNLANVLRKMGNDDAARDQLEQLLRRDPHHAPARFNLGNLLKDHQDWSAAEAQYRQALLANPDHQEAAHGLGNMLLQQNRLEEAVATLQKTAKASPRPAAWHDLGNVYRAAGQWADARAAYCQALNLKPDFALSRYVLGTLDLQEGNWHEGWQGYEMRFEALGRPLPKSRLLRWRGEVVHRSAALLVYPEQGLGDLIQFARFLPQLRERFGRVAMVCPSSLLRLFQASFPDIAFLARAEDETGFSHFIPMMSLGALLGITEASLDGRPYLLAGESSALSVNGLKVGLAWTGSPAQADNRWRSIPFDELAPFWHTPGVAWFSLQYGVEADAPLRKLPDGDFADTAALISQLDLVLTVCTSIAHLAGGLGRPVWLMSRFDADWRWQNERVDSPWYGSLRIYRQSQRAQWGGLIADVQRGLGT